MILLRTPSERCSKERQTSELSQTGRLADQEGKERSVCLLLLYSGDFCGRQLINFIQNKHLEAKFGIDAL